MERGSGNERNRKNGKGEKKGRNRSDNKEKDELQLEKKGDKNSVIPKVRQNPENISIGRLSTRSGGTEGTSRGNVANRNNKSEGPSSFTPPTDARNSQVERMEDFNSDQLPDALSDQKEIKTRSERRVRNYSRRGDNEEEEEKEWQKEEEKEKAQRKKQRGPRDNGGRAEPPRQSSIGTWRPDYTGPMIPADPLPFYYVVPENPAPMSVLPPGYYLVIPQNGIAESPLKVYKHPQHQSRNTSSEDDTAGAHSHPRVNKDQDPEKAEQNNEDGGEGTGEDRDKGSSGPSRETEGAQSHAVNPPQIVENRDGGEDEDEDSRPIMVDYAPALTYTPRQDCMTRENEARSSDLAAFDTVPLLKKRLPYCDEEEIRTEWKSECYKGWRVFVDKMRDRKAKELLEIARPHLPFADEVLLERELRALMSSQTSAEGTYEAVREMLRKQEILGFKQPELLWPDWRDKGGN